MADEQHEDAYAKSGYWGEKAAGAILFSPKSGKFGLGLRSAFVLEPGLLGSFGGAMDEGDSISDTLERELMEELSYVHPAVYRELAPYKSGDFIYYNHVAIINDEHFDPVLNWENDAIHWFTLDDLVSMDKEKLHFGIEFILSSEESWLKLRSIEDSFTVDRGHRVIEP